MAQKTINLIPQEGKQRLAFDMDVDVMIYGGGVGCLPASTEVLTSDGWKRIDACDNNSIIAQYDVGADQVSYLPVFNYIKVPCSDFYAIRNSNFEMTLSEEHNVLYKHNINYDYKNISWREALNRHERSKTKGWTGRIKTSLSPISNGAGIDFSEGELRLQVAVMADGRIVKEGKDNYTQMRFSKKRKYDRLLELCKKFGLRHKDNGAKLNTKYSNDTEYEVIVYPKFSTKHFDESFYSANQEQLSIIADEIRYWDGSVINDDGAVRYFSKYKADADFVQYALAAQGMNTSIQHDKREGKESFITTASFKGQGFRSFANKDGKQPIIKVASEDGFKYCFTTVTGYFVVRQNDKIFITGNSGKSYLCLLKALKYAYQDPAFNGVIFRRNTTPVREGLFATAKRLYAPLRPRVREQAMEIDFQHTHGGHLKFTHLEQVSDAERNHQGQEYTMVLFDELCQFEQEQFIYLLGRLRSESKTNAFCMATCNPDPDSFVLKWVEWYLDDEGYPDKNKIGVVRYFILKDDEPVFADTPEALIEEYPDLCYIEKDGELKLVPPQSFCFISANIFDNQALLDKEPRYLSKLKGQTDVMRRRLLEGNWYARAEGSNFFDRKWLKKIKELPDDVNIVRAWDKAYAEPSEQNRYPDYTSSIKMAKDMEGNYYVMGDYCNNHHDEHSDVVGSFRKSIGIRNKWMLEQAEADQSLHNDFVKQIIPKESGAGKGETELLIRMFEQDMIPVTVAEVTNIKNAKEKRFAPFSSAAENGLVYILEDTFNQATLQFFYNQLEKFDGTKSTAYKKDDLVDAVSDAYNELQQNEVNRPVKLPNKRINTIYNKFKSGFKTRRNFY